MDATQVENPFSSSDLAEKYQRFRPRYHDIPFEMLRAYLGKDLESALDVGCGTGHSTAALAKICRVVTGCDISSAMLQEARKHYPLDFQECAAEDIHTFPQQFSLVNISMAVHWVDQEKFLSAVKRVTNPGAYLSIDNYGFCGRMSGSPEFEKAHREFYERNFPHVTRMPNYISLDLAERHGFRWEKDFPYEHLVPMSGEAFVDFLLTQSNLIAHQDFGPTLREDLLRFYEKFFSSEENLVFSGKLQLFVHVA